MRLLTLFSKADTYVSALTTPVWKSSLFFLCKYISRVIAEMASMDSLNLYEKHTTKKHIIFEGWLNILVFSCKT